MAKINQTKKGRRDGGYSRLFGNDDLGALISQIHATSIRAGTELEHLIEQKANILKDIQAFLNNSLGNGVYLITKKMMKKNSVLKGSKEPDFLIVKPKENRCLIIEVKDGDTFDTKKAAGERKHLKEYQDYLSNKVPYKTDIYVCCFNQKDKQAISEGLKGEFSTEEVMTGDEFCNLLEINKEDILEIRKKDQQDNVCYLKQHFKELNI